MTGSFLKLDFSKEFSAIRELLACSVCRGELRLETDRLICVGCGRTYPIVDGIPMLTPQNS
jgi:uncharacterized protein YbaR (Trm112 family)